MEQQNVELAQRALDLWQSGRFSDSVVSLKQIQANLKGAAEDDNFKAGVGLAQAKVAHNLALANFSNTDRTMQPKELLKVFSQVAEVVEAEIKAVAAASGVDEEPSAHGEDVHRAGASDVENPNGNESAAAADRPADSPAAQTKARFQPDASFAVYNQAAVLVYMRKWRTALTLLEDLFRYIDALDEGLALCICFLLLDVYTRLARGSGFGDGGLLVGHIVERAQSVVDYLEKPHAFNGHRDWSSNKDSTLNRLQQKAKPTGELVVGAAAPDGSQALPSYVDRPFLPAQIKRIRERLWTYKYKLVLIQASISSAKAEAKSTGESLLLQLAEEAASPVPGAEGTPSGNEDAWQGMSLDERAASRSRIEPTQVLACLRANMEYLNGAYEESHKMLQQAAAAGGAGIDQGLFWNNMGCIHHMLGQHKCAAAYFARAFDFYRALHSRAKTKAQGEFSTVASDECLPEVAFNLGVQLLHCGEPERAHACFMIAARSQYHRPRLWLHVAECVVMAHAQSDEKRDASAPLSAVSGKGAMRRLLLKPGGPPIGEDVPSELSLQVGLRAIAQLLFLLDKAENDAIVGHNALSESIAGGSPATAKPVGLGSVSQGEEEGSAALAAKDGGSLGGGSPAKSALVLESDTDQCRQQAKAMRQAALLCRAYLALRLRDWSVARTASTAVIRLAMRSGPAGPKESEAGSLAATAKVLALAQGYLAEATLRAPADPAERSLSLDELARAMEASIKMDGGRPSDGRTSLCINAALVRVMQGQLDEAERLLHLALVAAPDSHHAQRLLVFLYLERGEHDRARRLLKTWQ